MRISNNTGWTYDSSVFSKLNDTIFSNSHKSIENIETGSEQCYHFGGFSCFCYCLLHLYRRWSAKQEAPVLKAKLLTVSNLNPPTKLSHHLSESLLCCLGLQQFYLGASNKQPANTTQMQRV